MERSSVQVAKVEEKVYLIRITSLFRDCDTERFSTLLSDIASAIKISHENGGRFTVMQCYYFFCSLSIEPMVKGMPRQRSTNACLCPVAFSAEYRKTAEQSRDIITGELIELINHKSIINL